MSFLNKCPLYAYNDEIFRPFPPVHIKFTESKRALHRVILHIRTAWHRGKAALTQTGLNGNENNGTLLPLTPRALTPRSTTRKKLARKVCLPPSLNPLSSLRSFYHYLPTSFSPLSSSVSTMCTPRSIK